MYLIISWTNIAELYPTAGIPKTLRYSRGLKNFNYSRGLKQVAADYLSTLHRLLY